MGKMSCKSLVILFLGLNIFSGCKSAGTANEKVAITKANHEITCGGKTLQIDNYNELKINFLKCLCDEKNMLILNEVIKNTSHNFFKHNLFRSCIFSGEESFLLLLERIKSNDCVDDFDGKEYSSSGQIYAKALFETISSINGMSIEEYLVEIESNFSMEQKK